MSVTIHKTGDNMTFFQDDKSYQPNDSEMRQIATADRLAQWRHYGKGPAYFKLGNKVIYRGEDLNTWVTARRVEPEAA